MLPAGVKAPSFFLRTIAGGQMTLEEILRHAPVLLVFYKGSCPVCQFALPFLERIRDNSGIRIFLISQDDAKSTQRFLKEFKLSLPVLLDGKDLRYPASNAFQISSVPSFFQVECDATISEAWEGWGKADMQALSRRAAMPIFHEGDRVPELRPG
ncbi:MAG TPA: TlpA disulfide reductase family protein [Bryobacteraceae bacterium]|nr:TlpA disulfide reductase family protein [Bryobacteraceae bacterium]